MKIALIGQGPTRDWHRRLRDRLAQRGHALSLGHDPASRADVRLLIRAERLVYGTTPRLYALVPPWAADAGDADLSLRLLFDGETGEQALVRSLLAGRVPEIEVQGSVDGAWRALARGLPANEEPLVFTRGIEQVLARLVALIDRAVLASERGEPLRDREPARGPSRRGTATDFFLRGLIAKIAGRLAGRGDHWRIAIRPHADRDDLVVLPDDGLRFQADPFLFEHEGRLQLFYEDFPYATRKGVIACVEIDRSGVATAPRVVLEQPGHLSYPVVLAHADAIYMLPEMGAARRVQLFRADPYPHRWTPDAVLIDEVVAGDATPVRHDGLWWIFATLAGDGGSSWDQLGLFHAPDLLGPWTAHAANPVLIDAGAARPAGAMWHEDGVLMRVAQDCRDGYGAGLAICRVDRLDQEGFAQTVVRRTAPPPGLGATGIHTLNRTGAIEVIDLKSDRRPRR